MILFVTGTDTDVGKTFACALLARAWAVQGHRVKVQKWVSTGGVRSADIAFLERFLGRGEEAVAGSDVSPYCLSFSASPHLAAEREGVRIEKQRLIESTRALVADCDLLLIEGVGGVLVPLRRDLLLADFAAELSLPSLVVARSGLGTLNHSLLTLEALSNRGVPVLGVLLNSQGGEDSVIVEDNRRTLAELGRVEIFGPIPRVSAPGEAAKIMEPIARRLWHTLEDEIWT